MFDVHKVCGRFTSPGGSLAVSVMVALALMMFPSLAARSRLAADVALAPGQRVADVGRREITAWSSKLSGAFASTDKLAKARDEIKRLRLSNQQLADVLDEARRRATASDASELLATKSSPLLLAELVEARVLGRQARAFLAEREIIDIGQDHGIQQDALVVSGSPLLDEGRNANVAAGDLVLAGRHIVGRIDQSAAGTSTLKRVTQPGYRDVVLLAAENQSPTASSPRGILEGVGEELCRIRHVATTAPVSTGDVVYAADEGGILTVPLIYGAVTRVEVADDNAHWEIWMQPRSGPGFPQTVAVLRARLNPGRLAGNAP